jgi:hypothetical protein
MSEESPIPQEILLYVLYNAPKFFIAKHEVFQEVRMDCPNKKNSED